MLRFVSSIFFMLVVSMSMVAQGSSFKVAFVYVGSTGDLGWTYEHDRGRKYLESYFGGKVQTAYMENVPEGPDAERVIRQYAVDGYDMIFTTSFGFMDPTITVAKEFPKVRFEHCSGYKTASNVSTYFGRIEESNYLLGLIAGKMARNGKIGFVAAYPIPEVIRNINWFTKGAREINPNSTVTVVWTYTWYDPPKEREAAISLLDAGVDFIMQDQDTNEPQKAAKERGKMSTGYNSDMAKFNGPTTLASSVWNWGSYYVKTVGNAMKGTWKSHEYWEGMNDDVVQLSGVSLLVPEYFTTFIDKRKSEIIFLKYDIYAGPIRDQAGKIRVPTGKSMTLEERANIMWLFEGVVGGVK